MRLSHFFSVFAVLVSHHPLRCVPLRMNRFHPQGAGVAFGAVLRRGIGTITTVEEALFSERNAKHIDATYDTVVVGTQDASM